MSVYDMIPEIFVGTDQLTATHLDKDRYVKGCDLIICISESTKSDVLSHYGALSAEIRVVPLSVSSKFSPNHPRVSGLPHDYILYVGKRQGYKDFRLLPPAHRQLMSEGIDLPVVVVGSPFTREERNLLANHGVEHLFRQVSLSDEALRGAYANCTVHVQTSRYEGFGLTPLEAMASGAPVVIARASSMPEVCGDVGQYFIPGDSGSLAETIRSTLADSVLLEKLRWLGISRAATFAPGRTAGLTAEAYRSVL